MSEPTTHARMITRAQQGAIHGLFRGIERDQRLTRIGAYVGRQITTTSDLSRDEATMVLDWLTRGGQ